VLKGASPDQVVQSRLKAAPDLTNSRYKPPDPDTLPQALQVVAAAKDVSHPRGIAFDFLEVIPPRVGSDTFTQT
jgi:hypothetical protein